MKRFLMLFFVLFVLISTTQGWRIYTKIRHAKRLKIGVQKFRLLDISLNPIGNIVLTIGNFSPSTFELTQIRVNALTMDDKILAEQTSPLQSPITLQPNSNTTLPIQFTINAINVIAAFKSIGGLSSVAANFLTSGKYGLKIKLSGFVASGNISVPINDTITI